MEELAVRTGADLVDNVGLEIAVDGSRNIFSLACRMDPVSDGSIDVELDRKTDRFPRRKY